MMINHSYAPTKSEKTVLEFLQGKNQPCSSKEIRKALGGNKYVYPYLDRLVNAGAIRRIERGVYSAYEKDRDSLYEEG